MNILVTFGQTIENLQIIRAYFVKLNHEQILAEIDRDIARLSAKTKNH